MTPDLTPVEIVAHRGANREAPENTLPAFRRAIELGVHGIELDGQYTRDHIPVVHHDPALSRSPTGDARPAISSLALNE
ncbi:MAG TPA: glycerophosphodiester phosphodiesterase, partial [Gemmatimonadaceae bacterium]|nr:glycerophosphodiester phosphodiesterase [Gemmatimonadaceae bacterium]